MLAGVTDLLADAAPLEKLYTGTVWGEGPVWMPRSATVRWSDIPRDRIMEFDSRTGGTRVYRTGVEFTNGRTLDRRGHVIQCSHGRRSVEMEIEGEPRTLVDRWEGGRFNSPNDVVVASDGSIWFTDPPYGISSNREGHLGEQEYGGCYVFRFDPESGTVTAVITDMAFPNGLAFSPDETVLYVSDTRDAESAHMRIYEAAVARGTADNGRLFASFAHGVADGFRVDGEGRIWTSSGYGVEVWSPEGEVLLRIPVPELVSNVCFGGEDGRDLYITASTSLYRLRTATTPAGRLPFSG